MASIKELIQSIEAADSSFDEKLAAINQMEETLVAMRQQEEEAINDNVDLIVEAIKVMEDKVNAQLEIAKSIVPEKGDKGDKGKDGKDGKNGLDGKDGRDGRDGKDGADGKDGVSVTDAKIDFDGSLIISLSTGQEINVGEVVASDLREKIHHITTMSTNPTGNLSSITSNDGSVTVTTVNNVADLSVAVASSTTNVICQVRNTTGATLTKGTAVYISGATGQIPTVSKALATSDATSAQTLGLMTADLANNTSGYVTVIGLITNIDTSAYTDGAQLYLSGTTAGTLTATKTYAPTHLVYVAVVEHAHPTQGKLFVKVQNGYELDEIHNVSAQSPTTGQTIVYNSSTSLWEQSNAPVISGTTINNTTIGASTPSTGTFTTLIGGGGSANYGQLTGGATTKAVEFKSLGSDTNVGLAFHSQGTGAIDLAAGSSGVNISNGGTVTAITKTAGGAYTTAPTITISAPTTAGGVQATATPVLGLQTGSVTAIISGGTGYTAGDTLTVSGGTFTSAATITVSTVSSGVITAAVQASGGSYTVLPTSPISVTGGTGSGATFTLSFTFNSTNITNAGSGYVEQPTVTFSSGSATAYATVGSGSIIRALGATGTASLDFYTPQSITAGVSAMRIRDNASDSYPMINNTGSLAAFVAQGNSTASLGLASNGSGNVRFYTNGTIFTEQMRVSHTASAVNYVQVTGSATGSNPIISTQGSDGNVGMTLTTKGTFGLTVKSSAGGNIFTATHGNSSTSNYLTFNATVSGSQPTISVANSVDADVDIVFTPKGAGAVRFGTYTGTILTPTGYITIKDSGGTTRRLLVG